VSPARQAQLAPPSGTLRVLDLTQAGIAEKVGSATNQDLMEALFVSDGMTY
jgi:hypothetical protein